MTTPKRIFLGWHRPAIELITERLLAIAQGDPQSFRRMVVLVPTRESGRRLREALAAGSPRGALLMPRIMQPHQLLGLDAASLASPLECLAAWLAELRSPDAAARFQLLFPEQAALAELEDEAEAGTRDALAHRLMHLCDTLSDELVEPRDVAALLRRDPAALRRFGLDSDAGRQRVAELLRLADADEETRWQQLAELAGQVEERLHRWGFISRREALAHRSAAHALPARTQRIVAACLPQLSQAERACLTQLCARLDGGVEIWVHAPEAERGHFDEVGLPTADWALRPIPVDDEHLHVAAKGGQMAALALRLFGGQASAQCALGVCDSQFLPILSLSFAEKGWPLYDPQGRSAAGTDLLELATRLVEVLRHPNQAAPLAALLRNGVAMQLFGIRRTEAVTACLEELMSEKFPARADALEAYAQNKARSKVDDATERAAAPAGGKAAALSTRQLLAAYIRRMRQFIAELRRPGSSAEALLHLAARLTSLSAGSSPYQRVGTEAAASLERLAHFLASCPDAPSTAEALDMLSEEQSSIRLQQEQRSEAALDALGWLELPYASGSHLLLAGLHEGAVPEALPDDPLLTEPLRQLIGADSHSRRLARDSYLLLALLHAHPQTDIIVARANADGDPCTPSSLLLRCPSEPPELLTDRIRKLFVNLDAGEAEPLYDAGDWSWHAPEPTADGSADASATHPATAPATALPLKAEPGEGSASGRAFWPIHIRIPQLSGEPAAAAGTPERYKPEHAEAVPPEPVTLLGSRLRSPWADPQRSFSPSSINAFLKCPLRFWLKRLLGVDKYEIYDEGVNSLDALTRGTLIHSVLEDIGKTYPEMSDGLSVEEIRDRALNGLHAAVDDFFCSQPPPSVRPLCTILERHLGEFARMHFESLKAGWIVEEPEKEVFWEPVEGVSFRMRVDRIDRHPDGRLRIIDYKTGPGKLKRDKADFSDIKHNEDFHRFMSPLPTFGKDSQALTDIQLPLYAAWAADFYKSAPELIETGYCVFPLSSESVQYVPCTQRNGVREVIEYAVSMMRAGACLVPRELWEGVRGNNNDKNNNDALLSIDRNKDLRAVFGLAPLHAASGGAGGPEEL
ncbi:MAG TPA: PD-(D/E)XK nuclease family protein [Candidatus Akkermansia intestinigallinarum]|uniref:PD-(D/E)XK nuclease family protein n=1 Tax=Candidatus Akkermansia intestinigallinarum TaxID=2838431 RepID=A0A9D1VBG1_9BACT|nr:PD-(D/E)XK nuclease family protein [Candidatus Akkermansia intestinigallinarum]